MLTSGARAYVNGGRLIADCTRPFCANAEMLTPGQAAFHCSNCQQIDGIDWPPDLEAIWAVLALRPVPETRNWFPAGHVRALISDTAHGQTVADLIDENHEYGVS